MHNNFLATGERFVRPFYIAEYMSKNKKLCR